MPPRSACCLVNLIKSRQKTIYDDDPTTCLPASLLNKCNNKTKNTGGETHETHTRKCKRTTERTRTKQTHTKAAAAAAVLVDKVQKWAQCARVVTLSRRKNNPDPRKLYTNHSTHAHVSCVAVDFSWRVYGIVQRSTAQPKPLWVCSWLLQGTFAGRRAQRTPGT